ncbi:MAG: chemotaxis protein CheD [Vicinamibacterales bacterium]
MSERIVIGIGEIAVTASPDATIVTHALGSCIAVCLWDPDARVGGMLHFLLPEAKLNPERARKQPGAFADTGIPLLFQTAYKHGADKKRCRVKLLGGAAIAHAGSGGLDVGKRNAMAAKRLLWQNGVMVHGEALGGSESRTVTMTVADGRLQVSRGREVVQEL